MASGGSAGGIFGYVGHTTLGFPKCGCEPIKHLIGRVDVSSITNSQRVNGRKEGVMRSGVDEDDEEEQEQHLQEEQYHGVCYYY